jgi:hypothetical protein
MDFERVDKSVDHGPFEPSLKAMIYPMRGDASW